MYDDPGTFLRQFTAFYPATAYDVTAISTGGRDWLGGHPEAEASPSGLDLGLVVPLHILDVPISAATDTLCLPWDIVEAIQSRKEQSSAVYEHQCP